MAYIEKLALAECDNCGARSRQWPHQLRSDEVVVACPNCGHELGEENILAGVKVKASGAVELRDGRVGSGEFAQTSGARSPS